MVLSNGNGNCPAEDGLRVRDSAVPGVGGGLLTVWSLLVLMVAACSQKVSHHQLYNSHETLSFLFAYIPIFIISSCLSCLGLLNMTSATEAFGCYKEPLTFSISSPPAPSSTCFLPAALTIR